MNSLTNNSVPNSPETSETREAPRISTRRSTSSAIGGVKVGIRRLLLALTLAAASIGSAGCRSDAEPVDRAMAERASARERDIERIRESMRQMAEESIQIQSESLESEIANLPDDQKEARRAAFQEQEDEIREIMERG